MEVVDATAPVDNNNDGKRDNPLHSKHAGYEIERFPRAGLVGSEEERKATAEHNSKYSDHETNVKMLNQNVIAFMTKVIPIPGYMAGTYDMYL